MQHTACSTSIGTNTKIYREFDSDGGSLNLNLAESGALRRLEARRQNVSVPRGSCSRRVVAHTLLLGSESGVVGLARAPMQHP